MQGPGGSRNQPSLLGWLNAHKATISATVGAAAAAYLAYKAYHSQSAAQLNKLRAALADGGATLSNLSSAAALVSSDLHAFLSSDSPEMPRSLRQLNRLLQSQEVQETLACAAASVTRGVQQATAGPPGAPDLVDKVLEAVLSDRGRTLVGMAVGLASKNSTQALCSYLERMQQASAASARQQGSGEETGAPGQGLSGTLSAIVSLLASDQGERLLSLLITKSIKTAVSTYVDATLGYNMYDDMIASIAKQEHREAVTEVMSRVTASFCREIATAYQRATRRSSSGNGQTPLSHASSLSSSSNSVISLAGHGAAIAPSSSGGAAVTASEGGAAVCSAFAAAGVSQSRQLQPGAARRRNSIDSMAKLLVAGVAASSGQGEPGTPTAALGSSSNLDPLGLPPKPGHVATNAALASVKACGISRHIAHHHSHHHHAAAGGGSDGQQPAWLKQVADLARQKDVRALALEVVTSATREATRSTLETLIQSTGVSTTSMSALLTASKYHMYVLMTVLISLVMYAVAPHTVSV